MLIGMQHSVKVKTGRAAFILMTSDLPTNEYVNFLK